MYVGFFFVSVCFPGGGGVGFFGCDCCNGSIFVLGSRVLLLLLCLCCLLFTVVMLVTGGVICVGVVSRGPYCRAEPSLPAHARALCPHFVPAFLLSVTAYMPDRFCPL